MATLQDEFHLLQKIVAPKSEKDTLPADLSVIQKIIREKIPQALQKQAPPNFPELYFEFEQVYQQFYDFLLFNRLIGKNIVALGGGFSSGKSSFLNRIMGKSILPSNIDPSTAVPTYIIQGENESAWGINAFDAYMELSLPEIKSIAHGFGADDEESTAENAVTFGHLLRSLFVSTPNLAWQHLAFLDTPGYSKPDSRAYSAKTDEKIARTQLNSSNYILWFVPADAGTISADDVQFLKELDASIPKLIIITKADKAPDETALTACRKNVEDALKQKKIQYEDILLFSRRKKAVYDLEKIEAYLQKIDQRHRSIDFARNFKKLFVGCKDYYDTVMHDKNVQLNNLNKALTLCVDDADAGQYLEELREILREDLNELKEEQEQLKKLQLEFFTEIKLIADKVGIQMPEPSEIDLAVEKMTDSRQVMQGLLKRHKLPEKSPLLPMLKKSLATVSTQAQKVPGGSQHQKTLLHIMQEELTNVKDKGQQLPGSPQHQQCLKQLLEVSLQHISSRVQCLPGNPQNQEALYQLLQDAFGEKEGVQ